MLKKVMLLLLALALLPLPAPAAEPTPAPVSPESAFFDDAVFVGDSLTNQIRRYRTSKRNEGIEIFGEARFLSAGAYSLYLAGLSKPQKDKPVLLYRGRHVSLSEGLKAMEAKRVYILLGLADNPGRDPERDAQRYTKMVTQIRQALPDIEIVALTITPITKNADSWSTRQRLIDVFNENLKALCLELDMTFVDVATPLKNGDGFLQSAYSNDKKVHLNDKGLAILTETLYQHAREAMARNAP